MILLLDDKPAVVGKFLASLSATIFGEAVDMCFGLAWEDPVMVCRLALSIAKDREDDSAPGNWTKVIADCEEKSSVLLSNLPTSDFQQTYAQLASMVKTNYIYPYCYELKALTEHIN